jgi:hypothetical protein
MPAPIRTFGRLPSANTRVVVGDVESETETGPEVVQDRKLLAGEAESVICAVGKIVNVLVGRTKEEGCPGPSVNEVVTTDGME